MNLDFFPGGLNLPIKQDCILDYAQTAGRRQYTRLIQEHLAQTYDAPPLALVHSFGCQQNAADGEKLRGMLGEMGYGFTDSLEEADFILYNTCAVRENAEKRVFGTVGALKHYKRQKPELLIALVGCMTQQQSVAERLKKSYPHVDIVAGATPGPASRSASTGPFAWGGGASRRRGRSRTPLWKTSPPGAPAGPRPG